MYRSRRQAEAVMRSVSPENKTAPPDVSVKTLAVGNAVVSRITCHSQLETFIATIDDLLASVQVCEKVLRDVKR